MPPQQPDRLLDFIDESLCFRAHDISCWDSVIDDDSTRI